MSQDGKKDHNIVDLASARKKQRTVQPKASGRPNGASRGPAKGGRGGKGGKGDGEQKVSRKVVGGIQLVLFLGALFYFLQLCRGPS